MTWRPISLLLKNEPSEGSPYHEASLFTHRLLRVFEAARAGADTPEAGNHRVHQLYWEAGARIHHDGDRSFAPVDVLTAVALDPSFATAADDDVWDRVIRAGMDEGLRLAGPDVGTPIIATVNSQGRRVAYFGPIITKIPPAELGLAMWDALLTIMNVDGFFELKRTRTERPDPGDRPDPIGPSADDAG